MTIFDPIIERISTGDPMAILGVCSIGTAFLIISSIFIRHIWADNETKLLRKLFWSFIALIPLFGWLAYGGLYRIPKKHGMACPVNAAAFHSGFGAPR